VSVRLADVRRHALRSLVPPPRVALPAWIEQNIRLPEGVSALPGAVRRWPYQREIADAISDPEIERVTMVKAARLGLPEFSLRYFAAGLIKKVAQPLLSR
jgi:phage terminase large subunit GpA-like protein